MSKTSPDIEALARTRLAADEERITGSRRTQVTLGAAWRAFWRHPSPWMISTFLLGRSRHACWWAAAPGGSW